MKFLLENYTQQNKEEQKLLSLEKDIREKKKGRKTGKLLLLKCPDFTKKIYINLKILDRQSKEYKKWEKQKRMAKLKAKVENNVSRDPCRLYESTKGWEAWTKKIGQTSSGPLLYTGL